MSSVILRFSKGKSGSASKIEKHHERTKEKYKSNPDINTELSKNNIHTITPKTSYKKEIDSRIKQSGCRKRKDSTLFVDTLITASPEFFMGKGNDEMIEYFKRAVDFMKSKIRPEMIFSAVIHLDERTPHMHLCFVPLTEDDRLSAKDILGNSKKLSKWQDEFHEYMQKFYPDIERGTSAELTHRKHIPSYIFKSSAKLQKMQLEIEQVLENTNILNSSKNTKKAVELIEKWIPKVETFETQINMLRKAFKGEENDKEALKMELSNQKDRNFDRQLEMHELQRQLANLKKLYSKVPEEVRTEIETRKRQREKEADR